jgi:TrmH family RNA methyltransferase
MGSKAIMFSKHASHLLKNAKVYDSIEDATKECSLVIGTTGIWEKANRTFKRIALLQDSAAKLKKIDEKAVVGVLIGRDDTGLSAEEIERCDMVMYIGTSKKYPVLNISHALALILYEFTKQDFVPLYRDISNRKVEKKELEYLFRIFDSSIQKKRIRNKKAVSAVFRRMVRASQPSGTEVHALITALKK